MRKILSLISISCVLFAQTIIIIPSPRAARLSQQVVDKFQIDPAIPASQTTVTYTLKYIPTQNTLLNIYFRSSVFDGDYFDSVSPVGPKVKELIITLPTYRPFTLADVLTVTYWTNE